MHKKTEYSDEYRGVNYAIMFWGEGTVNYGAGMWNYYILILEPQLSPEDWQKVWLEPVRWLDRSNGDKEPIYAEERSVLAYGDFHGGITFYKKEQTVDTDPPKRCIWVGCDYGHLFDRERGYPYSLATVTFDAQTTIDNLCEVLKFKRRCHWDGTYFYEEDGIWDEASNSLLSPSGWEKKQEWRKGIRR